MHEPIHPPPLCIRGLAIDPPLVLAPMAGVADRVYRRVMAVHGAGMVVTEMISVEGLKRRNRATLRLWEPDPELPVPCAVQLFGGDPGVMAEGAKVIEQAGVPVIDVNAGCPVRKVVRQGAGAALLRDPDRLLRIVEAVRAAVSCAVTVKMRTGWDAGSIEAAEVARRLEAAGADAIAVHGRTAAQLYGGRADLSRIAEVKRAVAIPVIGNGDVTDPESALAMLRETGCDAVMIGRGSFGNPWVFSAVAQSLGRAAPCPAEPSWEEFRAVARGHVEAHLREKPGNSGYLRKLLSWYTRGLPGACAFRGRLMEARGGGEALCALFEEWAASVAGGGGTPRLSGRAGFHPGDRAGGDIGVFGEGAAS